MATTAAKQQQHQQQTKTKTTTTVIRGGGGSSSSSSSSSTILSPVVSSPTSSIITSPTSTSPKIQSPLSPSLSSVGGSSGISSLHQLPTRLGSPTTGIGFLSSSSSSSLSSTISSYSSTITTTTTKLSRLQSPSFRRNSTGTTPTTALGYRRHIDTDEDIATIAKQISDHAEAIYQTWKARGLAPTEILNCHTDSTAGDAFGKALTPPLRHSLTADNSPVADFFVNNPVDMSSNNLEKLVSSFVNEDKARQQQQVAKKNITSRNIGNNNMSSNSSNSNDSANCNEGGGEGEGGGGSKCVILTSGTIKDALRKFEGISNPSGYVKPNFLLKTSSSKSSPGYQKKMSISGGGNIISSSQSSSSLIMQNSKVNTTSCTPSSSTLVSSAASIETTPSSLSSTHLNQNVPDVLIDSINQTKQLPKTSQIKSSVQHQTVSTTLSTTQQQHSAVTNTISSTSTSVSAPSSLNVNSLNVISSSGSTNNNSSTTTISVSSNIKKPQTPAKPANLINHTPSWPLKNRLNATSISSSGGSGGIGGLSIATNTNTKSNLIGTGNCSVGNNNSTLISKNCTKDVTDNSSQIISIELVKKSADLLDEVSREEERLINALKTGIILNSNSDNKLPEVITSTLNDSNKLDHYNRASNWIKKSNNVSPSASSLQQQRSSIGTKVASTALTSSSNTVTTSSLGSQAVSSTTSSGTLKTAPPLIQQQQQQQEEQHQSRSGSPHKWNDDLANKITTINSGTSTTEQSLLGSTASTTTTTTTSSTTVMTKALTSDSVTSTPAPTPAKFKLRPKNDAAVPHPEAKQNSNNQNNHMNNRTNIVNNPVRPFLTRGSVAERVLMFEKCPDVKAPLRNINRLETTKSSKVLIKPVTKPTTESPAPHTTLQRHIKSSSTKNVYIPKFHFPHGKPLPTITIETTLQRIKSAFDSFPNNQVPKEEFHHILKICSLPFYWRMPLIQCTQNATTGLVDGYRFIEFWKGMSVYCHDQYSRFVYILSRGQRSRPYILYEDLASLIQDVVDTHPGLAFLKEAEEFHSRYVRTVIARIFYSVNRSWSGKITVPELKRSNLLQVIQLLEEEEDINQIMAFFSYEHFYVIYCKFWELDRDHDLYIDQNDLARHNDHALSTRIIERIFSGCVTRGGKSRIMDPNGPKMSYADFIWFLLSEEDKNNPTAIEYWFRCMDLDGDGILSMYELEYFYEEQQQRMESIGIETLPFEDCLCQMLDMIKPRKPGCITLGDLKRCRMTPIFFDTFFNLEKYLEHEQRDPFATQRDSDDGMTDWDRYAAQEYELLVAEEGGDTQGSYDEDDEYESNIDILESQLDDMSNIINEW